MSYNVVLIDLPFFLISISLHDQRKKLFSIKRKFIKDMFYDKGKYKKPICFINRLTELVFKNHTKSANPQLVGVVDYGLTPITLKGDPGN